MSWFIRILLRLSIRKINLYSFFFLMALLKSYTTDSGIELELYYVVSDVNVQKGFVALDGYASQQARDDGKAPVNRITYGYATKPQRPELIEIEQKDLSFTTEPT
jgi:hypothetical protein